MTTDNSLLKQLEKNKEWPLRYMFKFIAPNNEETIAAIQKELPQGEKITMKKSKTEKYVAITCIAFMDSAKQIVNITNTVNAIDGVMTL